MTPEKKKQFDEAYVEYCAERDRLAAEGKPIGTFIGWLHENKDTIKIPMTREEYFGKGQGN